MGLSALPLPRHFPRTGLLFCSRLYCISSLAAGCITAALLTAAPAPAQHPPVVRGEVVDASTGRPVPSARVRGAEGAVSTTDADGGFVLRGLLPGDRELQVTAFGYEDRTVGVEARNGRITDRTIELHPSPLSLPGLDVRGSGRRDRPGTRVITRAEIEDARGRNLAGLLEAVPGVTVTRRGGPGGPATISIRGGSPDEVLVLFDGVPLNSLLTGEADLSTVPLATIERVVILPGTRSVRYGPRALTGVVVVEGRRPDRVEGELGAGAGSWDEWLVDGSLGGNLSLDGERALSGSVVADWTSSAGDFRYSVPDVRGGGTARRANADHAALTASGALTFSAPALTVRARSHLYDATRGMPGPVVQPSTGARQEERRITGLASASGETGSGGWQAGLDAHGHDLRFRDPDPPTGPSYHETADLRGIGARATGERRLGPLRVESGLELRHQHVASTMLSADAPRSQRASGVWTTVQWEHEWEHAPDEPSSVGFSPGLRLDESSLLDEIVFSPKAVASISIGRWTGRLSAGNAFSPPSLADQFFRQGVRTRPNPELQPERIRGELEATVQVREVRLGPLALEGQLSAFRSDVEGMILWLPDHRFVWRPDNVDVQRRGWEAEVDVRRIDGATRMSASVSRAAVTYAESALEGQVAYRPALTGNLGLSGTIGPLEARTDIEYVGTRRTVPGSKLNALDPYWLMDLTFRASLTPGGWRVEPGLQIDNALDREAAMIVDHPEPGRGWRLDVRIAPGGR